MLEIGKKPLRIAGLSIITSNEVASQELGKLWQDFFAQNIKDKLQHTTLPYIFAVYSNYENGVQGKYRTTVGYAVDPAVSLPEGLTEVSLPRGNYKMFPAKSSGVEDIVNTWKTIWAQNLTELPRNFIADCEVYDDKYAAIYIGVE